MRLDLEPSTPLDPLAHNQGNADDDPRAPQDRGPDADGLAKKSRYDHRRQEGCVDSEQQECFARESRHGGHSIARPCDERSVSCRIPVASQSRTDS